MTGRCTPHIATSDREQAGLGRRESEFGAGHLKRRSLRGGQAWRVTPHRAHTHQHLFLKPLGDASVRQLRQLLGRHRRHICPEGRPCPPRRDRRAGRTRHTFASMMAELTGHNLRAWCDRVRAASVVRYSTSSADKRIPLTTLRWHASEERGYTSPLLGIDAVGRAEIRWFRRRDSVSLSATR